MDLFKAMEISATGLQAQRVVINVISTNLANVHTTRTEEGGPYRRKQALFSAAPVSQKFQDLLSSSMGREGMGVKVDVVEDPRKSETIYDPSHPHADELGYVSLPNVNAIADVATAVTKGDLTRSIQVEACGESPSSRTTSTR